jgi:predicted Zn-dependent protease
MTDRALRALTGGLGALGSGEQDRLIGLLSGFSGLAFDRRQESEADHIGVFLMAFGGYPPESAVEFWQRMQQAAADQPRPPEILSDHPSDARRVAQLRAWVQNAQAAKKAFDEGRIAGGP